MNLTTQKQIFGFNKGYIWWVVDSIYQTDDPILAESNARYCCNWGWYFFDEPDQLDEKYKIEKLFWDKVGNEDGSLKDIILWPENNVGNIGDRIDINICIIATEDESSSYGMKRTHIMKDKDNNHYSWITSAKFWEPGSNHHIRGTIKNFEKGITILTRCMERK